MDLVNTSFIADSKLFRLSSSVARPLIVFYVVLAIFLPNEVHCQSPNLKFSHINVDQGLSQSHVRVIYEDCRGFMWFGTSEEGLNKYDGYKITVYQNIREDSKSLGNSKIRDIKEDDNGDLWLATGGGLSTFNRMTERFINFKHKENDTSSLSNNLLNCLLIDSEKKLWVGVANGGTGEGGLNLMLKNSGTFLHYLPHVDIVDIVEDHDHRLLLATRDAGLYLFDLNTKEHQHFKHDPNDVSSLQPTT